MDTLLRCMACHRLDLESQFLRRGKCLCGGRKVCGTSPITLFEEVKVLWWEIKLWLKEDFGKISGKN